MTKISLFFKPSTIRVAFAVALSISIVGVPNSAHANPVSDFFIKTLFGASAQAAQADPVSKPTSCSTNSQTTCLLPETGVDPDMNHSTDNSSTTGAIVGGEALTTDNVPSGTDTIDKEYASSAEIITYTVKPGDSITKLAQKFGISKNTIIQSNDFLNSKGTLTVGQVLTILPVDGVAYTVKKGDSIVSLSKKYSVASADILSYNNIATAADLRIGDTITIPGAVASVATDAKPPVLADTSNTVTPKIVPPKPVQIQTPPSIPQQPQQTIQTPVAPTAVVQDATTQTGSEGGDSTTAPANQSQSPSTAIPSSSGFIWPIPLGVGRISQGLHDDDAMDLAAPKGTPIYAPADGTILLAHTTGWNGGYGLYIVENFTNGGQFLAAHMSKNISTPGETVKQGDIIGYVGTTGSSTGNHVHLSFRGIKNPYAILKVGDTSDDFK